MDDVTCVVDDNGDSTHTLHTSNKTHRNVRFTLKEEDIDGVTPRG